MVALPSLSIFRQNLERWFFGATVLLLVGEILSKMGLFPKLAWW